ncbi:hypothetical protein CGLO_15640 [Colletotrichum gloeosporioides Cg-14]|uniref:Uncharacterized protein n=1 Tax=Colletotrichum gloeosporioides (strain Cg-14) TaxID=1237896 RepID=T0K199_COLGC|nr:hypothetical protein CGLO_15640 [Colletotrichum gloeosporioides Cg-14]
MELLSQDGHLRFRSMTELLSLTNFVFKPEYPSDESEDPVGPPRIFSATDGSVNGRGYLYSSSFTNVVARKDEFAVATLVDIDSNSPKGVIVVNVQPGESYQRALSAKNTSADVIGQVRCTVTDLDQDATPEGLIGHYLNSIEEPDAAENERLHFQVKHSFLKHASTVAGLLRGMRDADTVDTLHEAATQFRTYCIIAGCDKIYARFFRGSRNPSGSLATTVGTAATENETTRDQVRPSKPTEADEIRRLKEVMNGDRRNFYDILTYDISSCTSLHQGIGPSIWLQPLSEHSLARMGQILQFLRDHGCQKGLEDYHPTESDWYHKTKDREAFHHIVRSLVRVTAEKLDHLIAAKRAYHTTKLATQKLRSELQQRRVRELCELAQEYDRWASILGILVSELRKQLRCHMDWLEYEFCDKYSDSFTASPLYPDVNVCNHSPSLGEHILWEAGMGPYYDDVRLGHEAFDLSALDDWARLGWSTAAMIYLVNITAQSNCMSKLEPDLPRTNVTGRSPPINAKTTSFQLVEVSANDEDHEKLPLKDLFLTLTNKWFQPFTEEDQSRIWGLINMERRESEPQREDVDVETRHFSGETHPEAYAIRFHMLASARHRLGAKFTDGQENVVFPQKEVLDLFQENITNLAATGRCCTACDRLLWCYGRRSGSWVTHSEDHRIWVPCSLPPWIPRDIGEYMIELAYDELQYRLPEMIDHFELTNDLFEERKARNSQK